MGWEAAIPLIISGASALYAAHKANQGSGGGGGSSGGGSNMDAMTAILKQKQQQYAQQQPLRDMMMRQYARMLPTYMKADPGFAQFLGTSAPAVQSAMNPSGFVGLGVGDPGAPKAGYGYKSGMGVMQAAPSWEQTFGPAPKGYKYDAPTGNLIKRTWGDKWGEDIMPAIVMGSMTGGLAGAGESGIEAAIRARGAQNLRGQSTLNPMLQRG